MSAGCYGQMNGYSTEIFEMNDHAGGCCTAWEKNGYTIDTCIHWLIGSRAPSPFHVFWKEIGAIQGKKMVDHEVYAMAEDGNGTILKLHNDLDTLETHLTTLAPEDTKVIKVFIGAIKKCWKFPISVEKPFDLYTKIDMMKTMVRMAPFGLFFKKWSNLTLKDFSTRFRNPFLRTMFSEALLPGFGDNPDIPMLNILMTFAMMSQKTVCYPLGGSNGLVKSITERYLSLGGKMNLSNKVKDIIVSEHCAKGINLEDGSRVEGDVVISAIDIQKVIQNLLHEEYIDENFKTKLKSLKPVKPLIQIALGTRYRFKDLPDSVAGYIFRLNKIISIGDEYVNWLLFQKYDFDKSLTPPDKTVIKVVIGSSYEYWNALEYRSSRYIKEKQRIAEAVIDALDNKFNGLKDGIEMIDVATPLSFERYTGNCNGSYMGWSIDPKTFTVILPKTLSGLENFYMIGHWIRMGGGLPNVIVTGRDIIQILCSRDGRIFKTTLPE